MRLQDGLKANSTPKFFYMLLSCLALNAALLEHHNPVLTLVVADKFLLVSPSIQPLLDHVH